MKTMITLGDMVDKDVRVLVVARRRCERHGRLSIARLRSPSTRATVAGVWRN